MRVRILLEVFVPLLMLIANIMATAAAEDPIMFPLFSSLCAELRNQIWHDALPDVIGPTLCFYKKGCWCPQRLTESDEGYDHDNADLNLNFVFRHDLLNVQYDVPLFFVNRGARGIALAWVHEQGIELDPDQDRQHPVFVRPFDPEIDVLYVADDSWDDFLTEHYDRQAEPDLFDKLVNIVPNLTHLAVSEALLWRDADSLTEMIWLFSGIEVLYFIIDAPPELQYADNDMKVQRRWELESTQGGSLFWNPNIGGFNIEDSQDTGHEALYRLIEEASKQGLGRELAFRSNYRYEIRPVIAVAR